MLFFNIDAIQYKHEPQNYSVYKILGKSGNICPKSPLWTVIKKAHFWWDFQILLGVELRCFFLVKSASPGPNFTELLTSTKNYAYQNKVTSQSTLSHVQFVTGNLLISAKQENIKQYFLLKLLHEIEPRAQLHKPSKQKNLLSTDKYCLAETGYQPKFH